MKQTSTSSIAILIVLILFVTLFVVFTYTFLHEAGHALVGLLLGQSLTEFNVNFWSFEAHVGLIGGQLTLSQLAIRSLAGAGLPFMLWAFFIGLVPRKTNFLLEMLKLLSAMMVVNTLLAWIVLPILFIFEAAPSDDVTNFLRYSQIPPLVLAAIAAIFYLGGWKLFLSKIDGLRNEFLLFTTTQREVLTAGLRQTLPAMLGTMTLCLALVFTLTFSASKNSSNRFSPPQDFEPLPQIDLSARPYTAEALTQFSLDRPAYVGVFISVRDINTTYFDLTVRGSNGFQSTVLHGEGYRADRDGGLWEKQLAAGEYQVVLTAHQSPGTALIYLKTH